MKLEALLRAARDDQPGAWSNLIPRLHGELLRFFQRFFPSDDAHDLTQQTIVAAWEQLRGFEPRSSFTGWVYGIARNVGLEAARERARRRFDPLDEGRQISPAPATGPSTALRRAELLNLVREELQHIPEHYRVTIQHELDDEKDTAFATQHGISVHTVRSRKHRAHELVLKRVSARHRTPIKVSKVTPTSTPNRKSLGSDH